MAPSAELRIRMDEGGGVKTKTKRERERAMEHFLKFVYSQKQGGAGKEVTPVDDEAVVGDHDDNAENSAPKEGEDEAKESLDYKQFVKGELENGHMVELDIFNYFKE